MNSKLLHRFRDNEVVNRLSMSFPASMRHTILLNKMAEEFEDPEVKQLLVRVVVSHTLNGLNILRNILKCDKYYKHVEMPYNVFEWSMVHFKQRMDPNILRINTTRLEHPETVVLSKLMTDLKNIEDILRQYASGEMGVGLITLLGCKKMLNIHEDLRTQYKSNEAIVVDLLNKDISFSRQERQRDILNSKKINNTFARVRDEELVSEPLYRRHLLNEQKVHFEMSTYKMSLEEEALMEENQRLHAKMDRDNTIFRTVMSFLDFQIEEFKSQITYWEWRNDSEEEKLDNEIAYTDISLRSLRDLRQAYKDRIVFFHAEINRITERIKRQKEEDARARAAAIQRAEERKAMKASKKAKGKKGKK